jgi:hypothetical protein
VLELTAEHIRLEQIHFSRKGAAFTHFVAVAAQFSLSTQAESAMHTVNRPVHTDLWPGQN